MIFLKIACWTGLLTVTLLSPEVLLASSFPTVLLLAPDIPLSVLNLGGVLLLVLLLLRLLDLLLCLDLDLRLASGLLLLNLPL